MLTIRPARWPDDLALLATLEISFTTDRIYRVMRDGFAFTLVEERVDPPLSKEFGSFTNDDELLALDHVSAAEDDEGLAGFAAANYEPWNRRVVVWHLYVAARCRGRGVGRALIDEVEAFARSAGACCLWLETQNVNYPAIQFYRHIGFRLCGLDDSLYDPEGPGRGEVALFFVRNLS